jgi:hypothetical protein
MATPFARLSSFPSMPSFCAPPSALVLPLDDYHVNQVDLAAAAPVPVPPTVVRVLPQAWMEPRVPTDMSSPADWSLIHAPILGDTASASAAGVTLTIAEALSALRAEVHAMRNVLEQMKNEQQGVPVALAGKEAVNKEVFYWNELN